MPLCVHFFCWKGRNDWFNSVLKGKERRCLTCPPSDQYCRARFILLMKSEWYIDSFPVLDGTNILNISCHVDFVWVVQSRRDFVSRIEPPINRISIYIIVGEPGDVSTDRHYYRYRIRVASIRQIWCLAATVGKYWSSRRERLKHLPGPPFSSPII